jgi:hypothetical protein
VRVFWGGHKHLIETAMCGTAALWSPGAICWVGASGGGGGKLGEGGKHTLRSRAKRHIQWQQVSRKAGFNCQAQVPVPIVCESVAYGGLVFVSYLPACVCVVLLVC